MMIPTITIERRADGAAFVTLDRPEMHNAFNEAMIAELTEAFHQLGQAEDVRTVVLRARGRSFSAGADLDWMRRMAGLGAADNLADAERLGRLLQTIDTCPKPTVAAVQGAAFGGGVGLVACCDMAIAADNASFSLSEVRLGLIPAVISPYVVAAIGARSARRWFLTAERIDAAEAHRCGLAHQVVAQDRLAEAVEALLSHLREGAPGAQAAAKELIRAVADRPVTPALLSETAQRLATVRGGSEAREGIAAFLEKRKPFWGGR